MIEKAFRVISFVLWTSSFFKEISDLLIILRYFLDQKKEITALYMFMIKIIGSHMEDLPDN